MEITAFLYRDAGNNTPPLVVTEEEGFTQKNCFLTILAQSVLPLKASVTRLMSILTAKKLYIITMHLLPSP